MNLSRYMNEVEEARARLAQLEVPPADAPFTLIQEHHRHVSEVHKHLNRACRTWRRKAIVRVFLVWGERQAVTMGYMRFDEVDPNP